MHHAPRDLTQASGYDHVTVQYACYALDPPYAKHKTLRKTRMSVDTHRIVPKNGKTCTGCKVPRIFPPYCAEESQIMHRVQRPPDLTHNVRRYPSWGWWWVEQESEGCVVS